jgi:hypothetical protein
MSRRGQETLGIINSLESSKICFARRFGDRTSIDPPRVIQVAIRGRDDCDESLD